MLGPGSWILPALLSALPSRACSGSASSLGSQSGVFHNPKENVPLPAPPARHAVRKCQPPKTLPVPTAIHAWGWGQWGGTMLFYQTASVAGWTFLGPCHHYPAGPLLWVGMGSAGCGMRCLQEQQGWWCLTGDMQCVQYAVSSTQSQFQESKQQEMGCQFLVWGCQLISGWKARVSSLLSNGREWGDVTCKSSWQALFWAAVIWNNSP